MYNINIEVRDIILYFKHLMCGGPQQLKAKLCGFDQLDDDTCFWLIDFSQKILPIKFGGGGIWKRRMALHTDNFYKKIITYLKDYTFRQTINITKYD